MDEKIKLFDAMVTEGVRWLANLQRNYGQLIIKEGSKEATSILLEFARIAHAYEIDFAFRGWVWSYLYWKYIKYFKFLKRPPKTGGFEIDPDKFLDELAEHFNQLNTIFTEIYHEYF